MCILVECIHLLEDNAVWVVNRGGMYGARVCERERAQYGCRTCVCV